MKHDQVFTSRIVFAVVLFLSACTPTGLPQVSISTLPPIGLQTPSANPSPESAASPETPNVERSLIVPFVKGGDIHLWEEASGLSRTIVKAGDVTTVLLSDDGRVIAFLRRGLVEQPELMEYVSLWAVDSSGKNPRELVSAESLRQRLKPGASDSAGFAQIGWMPGTHRLLYSGSKHYLPGQGATYSKDIYVVDADTGPDAVLAPDVMPDAFANDWRFVISPDGGQIALISASALSFVKSDGSNWRQAVLTYPLVGSGDAVLLPGGVWSQDSQAFIFTAPVASGAFHILNYTIWRVPVDGSPAQSLAALTQSHSSSVTFSPDGKQMAFFQDLNGDGALQASDYRIMPPTVEAGPLAIPNSLDLSYANPHWSPGGTAFVIRDRALFQLCPGATESSEVCGESIHLGDNNIIHSIQWVDATRFLFTGLEPSTLSLGSLDGTITPIVSWSDIEWPTWSAATLR